MKIQTENKTREKHNPVEKSFAETKSQNTMQWSVESPDFKNLIKNVVEEVLASKTLSKEKKEKIQEKLAKADDKLQKITERQIGDEESEVPIEQAELDDLDNLDLEAIERLEKKGVKVIFPNLKYRQPKYKDVGEMMKYVESDKASGEGVKLVIMNFND